MNSTPCEFRNASEFKAYRFIAACDDPSGMVNPVCAARWWRALIESQKWLHRFGVKS